MRKTVPLGDEYDDALRRRVMDALISMGAVVVDDAWGVGGSQECERVRLNLDGREIVVEAETYVGLQITGDAALVDAVAAKVGVGDV